jgi:hypothetical protein
LFHFPFLPWGQKHFLPPQDLSAEGKNILKQQSAQQHQQDQINKQQQYNGTGKDNQDGENDGDGVGETTNKPKQISARAARRNELHHATLAGKGGLLLNTTTDTAEGHAAAKDDDGGNEKPAAAWDLEDCRTWLLEASRRIAQTWVEERMKSPAAAKRLPTAPLGEVEGQLVEHSITLCEQLESELNARNHNPSAAAVAAKAKATAKRVVTPRVTDMSKLGIKWQHAHERGSGGKGGVGNNARTLTASNARGGGRTAGQILILKTAKKLGSILNDLIAGEAFHKELRGVIGRAEERKRQALREEATRQRLSQMQRKPYLQARMQQ